MNTDIETDLHTMRVTASACSAGVSSYAIYEMIERVIQSADLKGSVLDYGAGTAYFTRRLLALQRFDKVAAADIMAAPVELAPDVEWVQQDLNVPLRGFDGAFDVVVAVEVIEHLENPRFMVREVFRLLRPGGTALITTPNNESWRSLLALLVRGHYAGFGELNYPAHITPLLRKDFTRIFREVGFPDPEFYFSNEGGLPGYPDLNWQQLSFGLLKGMRFSDSLLAVASRPR